METLIVQIGGRPGQVNELISYNGEAVGIGREFHQWCTSIASLKIQFTSAASSILVD